MVKEILEKIKGQLGGTFPELVNSFNPPATHEELQQVEQTIGAKLPEDLKLLYGLHNGESGNLGFFFGLPFLSLKDALKEWQTWKEVSESGVSSLDSSIISVPTGCIKEQYVSTKHFPIAKDFGGNNLSVDLDPDEQGNIGQVINTGRDEETRYVIAPSLTGFLSFMLAQIESGNFVVQKEEAFHSWVLKTPPNSHFLDTLKDLELPFGAAIKAKSTKNFDFNSWQKHLSSEWKSILNKKCGEIEGEKQLMKIRSLNLMRCNINDLAPLKAFVGLRELILTGNPISDVSPLSELPDLKKLFLAKTNMENVQSLINMPNLSNLSLFDTPIQTLEGLSAIKKLKTLGLEKTGVTDLEEVSKLKGLVELDISNNTIGSFEPLSGLKNIKKLDVSKTNIFDLSVISGCQKLEDLSVYETPVVDFTPIRGLKALKYITCGFDDFLKIKEIMPQGITFTISGEMTEEQEKIYFDYAVG